MKEEENNSLMQSAIYLPQRMIFSKEVGTHNTHILSAGGPMTKSVTVSGNVSEFNTNS
jgi:hypothetical protein